MLKVKKFTFNPFQENTYLAWDVNSSETLIVDPGCSNNFEENEIENFVKSNNLSIKYLINTHCHIDHILGNAFIKSKYNCEFYAPQLDIPLLEMLPEQASMFGLSATNSPLPQKYLSEDVILSIGKIKFKSLFTPGHSPGEFCIYFQDDKICFSGDVLFKESIGRTDLWGGNYQTLINSISEKLLIMPNDVKLFPGHGDETTIGYEKVNNHFINSINH